jgi:hypothetical protein
MTSSIGLFAIGSILLFITCAIYYVVNPIIIFEALGQEDSSDSDTEVLEAIGSPTFTAPNGEFKIGYPADAVVTPLEDVPGGIVSFRSANATNFTSIDIRISELGGTEPDLEQHANSVLAGLKNGSIPNFRVIQEPECEKYTLSGNEACTFIFGADLKDQIASTSLDHYRIMQLYSFIGDRVYNIAFNTPDNRFETRLNILAAMLDSFEDLEDGGQVQSIPRFDNSTAQFN